MQCKQRSPSFTVSPLKLLSAFSKKTAEEPEQLHVAVLGDTQVGKSGRLRDFMGINTKSRKMGVRNC